MKGRERQMSDLGDPQRGLDRLVVPHLADEHDVRVLPQRRPEGRTESGRVSVDLALVHDATLVLVQELDRVLDRQDVALARGVDRVDQCRESRALARPGRAGHEHQTARELCKPCGHRWESELVDASDRLRYQPVDRRYVTSLFEHVAPKARSTGDTERDVEFARLLEQVLLTVGQQAVHQPLGLVSGQGLMVIQPVELTVDTNHGRNPARQVEIRPFQLDRRFQQIQQCGHSQLFLRRSVTALGPVTDRPIGVAQACQPARSAVHSPMRVNCGINAWSPV